jgi:hypothetical protein
VLLKSKIKLVESKSRGSSLLIIKLAKIIIIFAKLIIAINSLKLVNSYTK